MKQPMSADLLCFLEDDAVYQQLLKDCTAAESAYLAVLRTLSPKDRESVETYISLCEEMDHRALTLATQLPPM